MTDHAVPGNDPDRLRELNDPEFMSRWALLRSSLFFIPKDEPHYPGLKRRYDAAAIEYRRRMHGGLAES